MIRRSILYGLLVLAVVAAAFLPAVPVAGQERPRTADEEFVPIDELPPDERLPAAPFLIAAYSVAWIVVVAYLWSIWQRLGRVEREMEEVARRIERKASPPPAPTRAPGPPDGPRGRAGGG